MQPGGSREAAGVQWYAAGMQHFAAVMQSGFSGMQLGESFLNLTETLCFFVPRELPQPTPPGVAADTTSYTELDATTTSHLEYLQVVSQITVRCLNRDLYTARGPQEDSARKTFAAAGGLCLLLMYTFICLNVRSLCTNSESPDPLGAI